VFGDDDKLVVRLEAPGLRRDDFEIELFDRLLVVHVRKRFERESKEGRYHFVLCAYGSFRRAIKLPVPVHVDKAKATYRDGVLRIELPKREPCRTQRIAIRG
jgi:HSP20 family protein